MELPEYLADATYVNLNIPVPLKLPATQLFPYLYLDFCVNCYIVLKS